MKNSIHRSRLRNAIVFFAMNTDACDKVKLFKLLYMLDFEHFKHTGRSVTGLNYEAWALGPVPTDLMNEWKALKEDLYNAVEVVRGKQYDHIRDTVRVRPGVEFDDENFTPRQLKILGVLCEKYLANQSKKMIDITHEQNGAWNKIWANGTGEHKPIPYEFAIADETPNRELILESALEASGISPPLGEGAY